MQTIIVSVICLGLLLWVEPASAAEWRLKVSVHKDLLTSKKNLQALTKEVDSILLRASMRLKGRCSSGDVTFIRNGDVGTFTSADAPSIIKDANDLELVHRVPADVKIVKAIEYCKGNPHWVGCSFRPDETLPKTMIVNRDPPPIANARPNLWAHEFGHTTGLHHRIDQRAALMTPCGIQSWNWRLTEEECTCLLAGPNNGLEDCKRQDMQPKCPFQNR